MAFSSGTFSRLYNWVTDRDNGVSIQASRMDDEMDGFATGLSACLLKDGTQTVTADIPMATYKFTGLGAGSAAGHSMRWEQTYKLAKGADVASATDLLVLGDGQIFDVTGTTTIATIDSGDAGVPIGSTFILQFDGALTLTHHATDLILPGGANITTAAGDHAIFTKYAAGDCRCVSYTKADAGLFAALNTNSFAIQHSKGADVASASNLLVLSDGNYFDITGTTTVTGIDTADAAVPVGTMFVLQFDGALTLTHHATDLVLPGGANITTAAGDHGIFVKYAAGDCRCISFTRASGNTGESGNPSPQVWGTDIFLGGQTIFPMWREHNLIVNSHFQVSQENGDTQGSANAYYMADQWQTAFVSGGGATFTIDRDAAHPCLTNYPEIPYMLKADVTSGAAQQAGDVFAFRHRIEGIKIKGLFNWGASGGKDLEIGFLCRADYTGTGTISVRNTGDNRSYLHDFAFTADTDTWVTATIPEDASGTWSEAEGAIGIGIDIVLDAGSTYQGTNNTWEGATDLGTSSTSTFLTTTGNTFWLGPVLVFPEGIPMPADANELHLFKRPFDRDLWDCKRYYEQQTAPADYWITGQAYGANNVLGRYTWDREKCKVPTVTLPSTVGNANFTFSTSGLGAPSGYTSMAANSIDVRGCRLDQAATGSSFTAGNASVLFWNTGGGTFKVNARL